MRTTLAILLTFILAAPAAAVSPTPDQPSMATPQTGPQTGPQAGPETSPATKAFQAALDRMMTDMGRRFSGNVDQDFIAGMIPHHRGAVEAAQIELQYGKDPVLKRFARQIIKDQDREIIFMHQWQQRHPPTPTP